MNILFINTIDTKGGAPRVAYSLKEALERDGHYTSLFVKFKLSKDPHVHNALFPSLPNRVLKAITGKDLGAVISSWWHYNRATDIEWFNTDKIMDTPQYKKADVIHLHNLHGNYFKLDTLRKMSLEKPIVWTFHDMWPITSHCGHAYDGALKDGFYTCPSLKAYQELKWDNEAHLMTEKRRVYDKASFHIVVPSQWLADKVSASVLGTHPTSLIYNGIDENIFTPLPQSEARTRLGLPVDKKIVLFSAAGGLSDEKGGAYFKALADHHAHDDRFLFICIGEDAKNIANPQSNVRYVPYISDQKTLASYYAASDIFLFASLAENFPLAVLESLSAGLPVLSFDVGGVKEAVEHRVHGYISKYKDTNDLITGMEYLTTLSPEATAEMKIKARERILQNFTLKKMYGAYLDLYRKLANDFRKTP